MHFVTLSWNNDEGDRVSVTADISQLALISLMNGLERLDGDEDAESFEDAVR